MLDLFFGLKRVVKRQPVHIDNSVFRMHWLFSSLLLAACSLLVTSHQYVGQPIDCLQTDRLPTQLLNTYCWMHSTYTLPPDFQGDGQQAHPGVGNTRVRMSPDQSPVTIRKYYTYYQWVCFALFVQSIFFYLPYYLWKIWEGGLLRSVTTGMQYALVSEQERGEKRVLLNQYLYRHMQLHRPYALKYFFCELLCLINVVAQFCFTDWLFDGDFLAYGFEVIRRGRAGLESAAAAASEQPNLMQSATAVHKNVSPLPESSATYSSGDRSTRLHPMLRMFPRITKCSFHSYGYSGDIQRHDALCLLPLNVLNEKIYLVIWVWFVVLLCLLFLVLLYRLLLVTGVRWRAYFLRSRCRLSNESDLMCICALGNIGDWFLLYMLAANVDPLLMHEITTEMAAQLRCRRQRESSLATGNYSIASACSNCSTEPYHGKWMTNQQKSLQDQCAQMLKSSSLGKSNEAYSYDIEKANRANEPIDRGTSEDAEDEEDDEDDDREENEGEDNETHKCWTIDRPNRNSTKLMSRRSADSGVSGSSGGWSWFGCASAPLDLEDEKFDRQPYPTQCCTHTIGGPDSTGIGSFHGHKQQKAMNGRSEQNELVDVLQHKRRKKAIRCVKQLLGSSVNPVLGNVSIAAVSATNLHTVATNGPFGDDNDGRDSRQLALTGSSLSDDFSTSQLLTERRHLWTRRRSSLNNRMLFRNKGLHSRRALNKLRSPLGVLPSFVHQSSVQSKCVDRIGNSGNSSQFASRPAANGASNDLSIRSRAVSAASSTHRPLPSSSISASPSNPNAPASKHNTKLPVKPIKSMPKSNNSSSMLKCKSDQSSSANLAKSSLKTRPNQSTRR